MFGFFFPFDNLAVRLFPKTLGDVLQLFFKTLLLGFLSFSLQLCDEGSLDVDNIVYLIEYLSYTKENYVLMKINQYPIIATHAHTRPFQRKWLNIITGLFLPTGIFFYFRMLRFRFRLYKDLQHIQRINKKLIPRVIEIGDVQKEMNPII